MEPWETHEELRDQIIELKQQVKKLMEIWRRMDIIKEDDDENSDVSTKETEESGYIRG